MPSARLGPILPPVPLLRLRVLAALLAAAAAPGPATAATSGASGGPVVAAKLAGTPQGEASGLAASRLTPGVVWTHDDSGGAPELYAFGPDGAKRGTLRLSGVENADWEDLASFERDGQAWLLVADVGDNGAIRKTVRLHLVAEPPAAALSPAGPVSVNPAFSLTVRYEDGPRDCEGVAVDPQEGMVYLLSKRDPQARLYGVPLAPATGTVVARFLGVVSRPAAPSDVDALLRTLLGPRLDWPTALDFSADGRTAVVLTYAGVFLFPRSPGESWAAALSHPPHPLRPHGLRQAEGACLTADGRAVLVVSEGTTEMLRYDLPGR